MLQESITNSLQTSEKIENVSKESYKKKSQMEMIKSKNPIIEIKILRDRLSSGVEVTENRIRRFEDQ
jgi:hypothetical protein